MEKSIKLDPATILSTFSRTMTRISLVGRGQANGKGFVLGICRSFLVDIILLEDVTSKEGSGDKFVLPGSGYIRVDLITLRAFSNLC